MKPPLLLRRALRYRSTSGIDLTAFVVDLAESPFVSSPAELMKDLSEIFSGSISSVLDKHAPIRKRPFIFDQRTHGIHLKYLRQERNVVGTNKFL